MEIKINDENNKTEKIEVSVSKTYNEKLEKEEATCKSHVGREVGEEIPLEEVECESKEKKVVEEIRELLVPIAVHEAKSAFYKLKLAKVVVLEGGKIAAKGAVIAANGAKFAGGKIQTAAKKHKENKEKKGGKNEKTKSKDN